MDFEQQQRLEKLHEMFKSDAWGYLYEAVEKTAEAGTDLRNIKDIETLYFLKGKLSVLDELKMFPEYVEAQLDDAL